MAITFPEFEGFDLINGCCCGNSTIGLVSVEVFYHHLMLLGILEKGFVCDFLSFFFDLTHFLTSEVFCGMEKEFCLMYCLLILGAVLASLYQILDALV